MEAVEKLEQMREAYQRKGRGMVSVENIQNLGYLAILDELAPYIFAWWKANLKSIATPVIPFGEWDKADSECDHAFTTLKEKADRVLSGGNIVPEGTDTSGLHGPHPGPPFCKCTLVSHVLGDGCEVCNPELAEYYSKPGEDRIPMLESALKRSMVALDDWLNLFAPEFCDEKRVQEAQERVNSVGTVYYIAVIQKQNREALGNQQEIQ